MKVALDLDACRGNGACVVAAPDLFDYDDDSGQAVVLQVDVSASSADAALMAVLHCPTRAISLRDDE